MGVNRKMIVMIEKPADGLPPMLVMGVAEESQMAQVQAWAGENNRRGWCVTEKLSIKETK